MSRDVRCTAFAAAFFLLLPFFCAGTFTQWNFAGADFGQWKKFLEVMTGFWLLLVMMACMLTALRIPAVDRFFGGLSESLRSHRTMGIASAVVLFLHWAAASGPKWLVALGLMEPMGKRKGPSGEPQLLDQVLGFLRDSGQWLGYAMIIFFVLALFGGIPKACFGAWPLPAVLLCTAACA